MSGPDLARRLASSTLLNCAVASVLGSLACVTAALENPSSFVHPTPEDGYRGIWYANEPSGDEYAYKYSGGLGTYCAKHNPFAVYCPDVRKTFFCYGGTTKDSFRELVHMVSYYDHDADMVPRPRLLLNKRTSDAHDNPVIAVDAAGHVWIFSTSHGRSRPSFVHRSVEPYSIDVFERVETTHLKDGRAVPFDNFSYMQVWHRPRSGFLAFFTRYGDPAPRTNMFATSADGRAWSQWQRLAAIEAGHYQISAIGDTKAAAAFNFHPQGKGLNFRTNLYYMETTDGGTSWHSVDGTNVGIPLTEVANPCLVHDFRREGKNVYLKDIAFDDHGRPVILIVTSAGYESGPKNDPREWLVMRWDGAAWRRSVVTPSDNNYDMGSLYLEGAIWRIVAPTATGPQAYNPGGEVMMWTSRDRGATWRIEKQLTAGSPRNHTYVRRPVGAHPELDGLWADGNARQPSESRLYFCNQAGDVFQLPRRMTENFAKPIPVR